ncbi:MAG: ATP-binding cassette domain-containing protein [Bacilli bacterium]|nr:ATP-binding cassette domain-containing protein [Bacilli bacterium]
MNTLEFRNITFSYKDNLVFDNLSLKIKKGQNTMIIAPLACGKTTLAKLFQNKLKKKGEYLINGVEVVNSNAYVVDRFVNVVYKNDDYDSYKVVDLLFDNVLLDDLKEQEKEVQKIIKYFNLNDIISYKLNDLTIELKYYILIIINLIKKDIYLVIDDLLCYLKKEYINKIYTFAKKNKITIINISSRLDEVFFSSYLICLYNNNIAMEGEILSCLKEEKLLKRLGYKLPFMYDLSLQLNYYEVLKGIYLDYEELEANIWK